MSSGVMVRIEQVKVGERKRPLDRGKVAELRGSIEQVGLLQPIVVTGEYELVAGRHRLEACRLIGWNMIPARVLYDAQRTGKPELLAELAEIDENLMRNELTPIEEGEHFVRRDEILQSLNVRLPSHRPNKCEDSSHLLKSSDDVAGEMGVSRRVFQQRKKIATDILPDVKDSIRHTEFASRKTDLLDLSRLPDDEQRAVAEFVVKGEARTLAEAQAKMNGNGRLSDDRLINQSNSNEWYTPAPYVEAARLVMGGIDLDPASCDFANRVVKATHFLTKDDDGLSFPWYGRVWLNPPYGKVDGVSNQARWSRYLIEQYEAGNVEEAVLLVNAVPGNKWFGPLWDFPICFPDHRIVFYNEDTEKTDPTHSNALVYLGPDVERFAGEFGQFGVVAVRYGF